MVSLDGASLDNNGSIVNLGSDLGPLGDAASPSVQASWGEAMADAGLDGGGNIDDMGWGGSTSSFTAGADTSVIDALSPRGVPATDGVEAGQPDSANSYARQAGESADDWVSRLGDASNTLNGFQATDPERANAGRLQMNAAIESDPKFQSNYFADAQCLKPEAFRNPAQYGGVPVADQSVGYGASSDQSIEQRLQHFAATNISLTLRMGADGVIYDFGKSVSQASQAPSALSAIHGYNDLAANNLGEQISKNGFAAVPPEIWATSLLGMTGAVRGDPAQGPATLSPTRRLHILDGDKTGGGHRPGTGMQGKSEFPAGWSDNKIIREIEGVANDPSSTRTLQPNGRTSVEGTRDGVTIRVIVNPDGTPT